jgi:hypothetical protein
MKDLFYTQDDKKDDKKDEKKDEKKKVGCSHFIIICTKLTRLAG